MHRVALILNHLAKPVNGPEKASVGGSIPSLATNGIRHFSEFAAVRVSPYAHAARQDESSDVLGKRLSGPREILAGSRWLEPAERLGQREGNCGLVGLPRRRGRLELGVLVDVEHRHFDAARDRFGLLDDLDCARHADTETVDA